MAVINLNIGNIIEDCPNLTIPDNTDYAGANVFVFSDFKFHDYTQGLPALNGEMTFGSFNFGPYNFSGVSIAIETDGAGNVINPEQQYMALKEALNAASTPQINIEFVQPSDTGYRDWFLRISTDTSDGFVGESSSVATTGDSINPLFTDISSTATPVSVRNLTLLDKEDNPVDLGAVAQIDELALSGSYTIGQTFNLDFCGDVVTYTVEDGETTAECVAAGIEAAVLEKTGGLFEKYVDVSRNQGTITFTSKEAGVPLNIQTTYDGLETFVYSTTTANVSSMSVPSYVNSDEVVYETAERGGQYTAILTVVSECDYNSVTREFFSWCFDLSQFDCCFVNLVKGAKCCCKVKDKVFKASTLRNIIIAVPKMIEKGESESKIQKVVDMGWSICEPLNCGCSDC